MGILNLLIRTLMSVGFLVGVSSILSIYRQRRGKPDNKVVLDCCPWHLLLTIDVFERWLRRILLQDTPEASSNIGRYLSADYLRNILILSRPD
jgi:hypothetical protein